MGFHRTVRLVVAAGIAAALSLPALAETRTHSVHRSKGADGVVDKTVTGPHGNVTTVDRNRNADGTVNVARTGPKGQVSTVTRNKDATGATDAIHIGPEGGTKVVDRTRNPDGTVDKSVTTMK